MTKDEELAMDLALEALEICEQHGYIPVRLTRDAITAIKQARLAPVQPVQEPVAIDADMRNVLHGALVRSGKVISPPAAQRQWVGLPFGEICEAEVIATDEHNNFSLLTFARAIEAKLKERNT